MKEFKEKLRANAALLDLDMHWHAGLSDDEFQFIYWDFYDDTDSGEWDGTEMDTWFLLLVAEAVDEGN